MSWLRPLGRLDIDRRIHYSRHNSLQAVVELAPSHRDAVFWLNIHLTLLAANQSALQRMRALVFPPSESIDHEPDFRLMSGEAERLLKRIVYWEGVVDRFGRTARLRPILAGFRLNE